MTKTCKKSKTIGCGKKLDVSKFYMNGNNLHTHCKACMKTYEYSRKIKTKSRADVAREMCNKLIKENTK